jgi:hypothetical protein
MTGRAVKTLERKAAARRSVFDRSAGISAYRLGNPARELVAHAALRSPAGLSRFTGIPLA